VPDQINHATAGNIFMLGAGGIFVVWFSAYFGRLPVLVFFQSLNLATSAWSGSATSFESFETARILHGFFACVAAAVSQRSSQR
jgi:MFS family permease